MTKLYVVATPIGNLEDISLRAKRILQEVDWIAAEDTRHSRRLLQNFDIDTKLYAYHQHNEETSAKYFVDKLTNGHSGAIITDAGTPCISDPGYHLIKLARQSNIEILAIPGASSSVAALSISGMPVNSFTFIGFLPAKQSARVKSLSTLSERTETLIFFEAPHRIQEMLESCVEIFGANRQALIAREMTKQFEQSKLATLGELLEQINTDDIPQKGEFVVIVSGNKIKENIEEDFSEIDKILVPLLKHVKLKEAVQITVEITGSKKNAVYQRAVNLTGKS
jgi:16S rRNA (cytidine1402-2'-O)-methyltransferase